MILCCGEALIDMVPRQVDGAEAFLPVAGGAVMNTAVTLGRLGVDTGFFYGVSNDMFGEVIVEHLARSQVSTRFLARSDRPTTLAFVKLTNGQAKYTFYDENSAGRMLSTDDFPNDLQDVSALFFGGISLCVEPAGAALQAFALANSADRVIMLDPNIRPGFISDEERYRDRINAMMAAADNVKISDEDLDWLFPGENGMPSKLAALLALGPSVCILTKGSDGADALASNGARAECAAQKVQVVDTIGAGDSFNGAALAYLLQEGRLGKADLKNITADELHAMLDFAGKVAAVTVSRAGANPPWAHEL